jgi:hypothetical protein
LDDLFSLGCDFLLDIFLQSSKHEGLKDEMQSLQLMLVQFSLVHGVLLDVLREPLLELLMVVEKFWHDEMQKCPELCHRILDWRTRKKQSISGVELQEGLPSSTGVIFDCLSLIKNHVMPLDSLKS